MEMMKKMRKTSKQRCVIVASDERQRKTFKMASVRNVVAATILQWRNIFPFQSPTHYSTVVEVVLTLII